MWQQIDCSVANTTAANPSGCLNDLFPWVEVTIGAGSDGSSGSTSPPTNYLSTGEGSTAMEFFNMQKGDAPYFKSLADTYTLSDNFHQSVMGGTMRQPHRVRLSPIPSGTATATATAADPARATRSKTRIRSPAPTTGTTDGYGAQAVRRRKLRQLRRYQPARRSRHRELPEALPRPVDPNCEAGHYYILNNYNPGYNGDGSSSLSDSLRSPFPDLGSPHRRRAERQRTFPGSITATAGTST